MQEADITRSRKHTAHRAARQSNNMLTDMTFDDKRQVGGCLGLGLGL